MPKWMKVHGKWYRSITEVAKAYDMSPQTLRKRIASGMPIEEAAQRPAKRKRYESKNI